MYPNDVYYLHIGGDHVFTPIGPKWMTVNVCSMLRNKRKSIVYDKVFSIGQGLVNCKSSHIKRESNEEYSNLRNIGMYIDDAIIKYFDANQVTKPTPYVWQPKGRNTFDLYLIAAKYDEEKEALRISKKKNTLHLIY